MYEEEDDDLPLQYLRLTAHLQTGSADFNRRLAAYLTNHVAMRSALDQAINDSYAQQFPNAPTYAHNQASMFPSPIMTHGLSMAAPGSVPLSAPPRSSQFNHQHRQVPYPSPGAPGYRQNQQQQQQQHQRSASLMSPHPTPEASSGHSVGATEVQEQSFSNRRMSMPAAAASTPGTPLVPQTETAIASSKSSPSVKVSSIAKDDVQITQQAMVPPNRPASVQQTCMSPLTMSLPQDSQQLLWPALNTGDPFASLLMSNGSNLHSGYFDTSYMSKDAQFYSSVDGMNATLAPSAMNNSSFGQFTDDHISSQFTGLRPNGDMNLNFGDLKGVEFSAIQASGTNTPAADTSWDAFINGDSWTENNT